MSKQTVPSKIGHWSIEADYIGLIAVHSDLERGDSDDGFAMGPECIWGKDEADLLAEIKSFEEELEIEPDFSYEDYSTKAFQAFQPLSAAQILSKTFATEPSREGSKNCEAGSVASGGDKTYCTCDTCF